VKGERRERERWGEGVRGGSKSFSQRSAAAALAALILVENHIVGKEVASPEAIIAGSEGCVCVY
jgi:hypothetical protein